MKNARLVWIDAESDAAMNSLRAECLYDHVPKGHRALEPLRLSDFGCPQIVRDRPLDWQGVGDAVMRLVDEARKQGRSSDPPDHTVVGGFGPLPVFALAGFALHQRTGGLTLVNPRENAPPDVLDFGVSAPIVGAPFDIVTPLEASDACGLVALLIATNSRTPDLESMEAFCRASGHEVAGVVELRARDGIELLAANAGAAYAQMRRLLDAVPSCFRESQGTALFIDGPATLAFLAGRAINPNAYAHTVHVPNRVRSAHRYEPALTLPWPWQATSASPLTVAPLAATRRSSRATILYFSASPETREGRLASGEEARAIQNAIDAARCGDALRFEQRHATRPEDLLPTLRALCPDVVHFGTHGRAGGVVLQRDADTPHHVGAGALVELFGALTSKPRLVVLSACDSAASADALAEVVGCVIGMPAILWDDEAGPFAQAFYGALASGESVKDAFEQARANLNVLNLDASPTLHTRPGMDPASLYVVRR